VSFQGTEVENRLVCFLRTNMPFAEAIQVSVGEGPGTTLPLALGDGEGEPVFTTLPSLEHGLILLCRVGLELSAGTNVVSLRGVNGSGVAGPPATFELEYVPE
jgi:hypothetical protein